MPNENLDRLEQEVTRDSDVTSSAVTLLNGLGAELQQVKSELAAQGVDNDRLNGLVDGIKNNSDNLAAAITANTPVA